MANTHPSPLHPSPVLQMRTWSFAVQIVEASPVHTAWVSDSSCHTPSLGAHAQLECLRTLYIQPSSLLPACPLFIYPFFLLLSPCPLRFNFLFGSGDGEEVKEGRGPE